MLGHPTRPGDHLVVVVHVAGAEVNHDVHDEQDVHHDVHHVQRVARVATRSVPVLVHQERRGVRREDGRVQDQEQDDPVPEGFERAVVQQDPPGFLRELELVLWQHVGFQREDLGRKDVCCYISVLGQIFISLPSY